MLKQQEATTKTNSNEHLPKSKTNTKYTQHAETSYAQ